MVAHWPTVPSHEACRPHGAARDRVGVRGAGQGQGAGGAGARRRAPGDRRAGLRHPAPRRRRRQEALAKGPTHYVPAPGIPELRTAVAAFLERTGRLRTTPDRVVVTPGAKPIMFFTILALCQEGDEVLYPDPGFPMYASIAAFAGATPVPVPLREEQRVRHRPGRAGLAGHRPDQAADPQLPAQPVRQRLTRPTSRRSPRSPSSTTWWSSATRSTGRSATAASTPACSTSTAWPSGPCCWTAGPRRSR